VATVTSVQLWHMRLDLYSIIFSDAVSDEQTLCTQCQFNVVFSLLRDSHDDLERIAVASTCRVSQWGNRCHLDESITLRVVVDETRSFVRWE